MKYEVIDVNEAIKQSRNVLIDSCCYKDDYSSALIRIDDNEEETLIFIDSMEPEDATIGRDLSPLVSEILKLAEEIEKLRGEIVSLKVKQ